MRKFEEGTSMALMETKIIQVTNDPGVINSANNEWASFGWSVLSIQITHSQDTKTYSRGLDYFTGDSTVETTTINYASITYQRDKKMENYQQIAQLEREYQALIAEMDEKTDAIIAKDQKISLVTLNPLKALKSTMNLARAITGKEKLSRKAQEECEKIVATYRPKLESIQLQAENLL